MPKSSYEQVESDEWIPWHKRVDLACCDCGLVHHVRWRIRQVNGKKELQLSFARNGPATGGIRRALKAATRKRSK